MDEGADELLSEVQADDYYAIVPEWILFHPELSHGAVRLYAVLRRFADQRGIAFPGLSAIGEKYGVVPRSVTRHMEELMAAGAVTKKRRTRAGRATSNLYRVHSRPTFLRVKDDFSPDTTAATTAASTAAAARRAGAPDDQRTKMSDGDVTKMSDGPTDKNVRLTTATLNHSQVEPQTAEGKPFVVVSPPVARTSATTTPEQKLTDAGVAPRDRGRFREYLRTVKGARSANAVIATADPDDLVAQVREWRASLDIATEPDAEPVLCDHGHDVALGAHMCPVCDPDRPHLATVPDAVPERPQWLQEVLAAGEQPGLADLLDSREVTA